MYNTHTHTHTYISKAQHKHKIHNIKTHDAYKCTRAACTYINTQTHTLINNLLYTPRQS